MRYKKSLILFLTLILGFLGSFNVLQNSNVNANSDDVFRVSMEVDYAPFNWSQKNDANGAVEVENSSGEYANGYDVQIAKRVAEGLGKKLVIVKTEWDGLVPGILADKADAIVAGMSPTKERREKIDFTERYYNSDLVLVVKRGSEYEKAKNIHDFKGARVTAQLNTFHYSVIEQIEGVNKLPAMDNFSAMLSALNAEKIDAYVSERPGAMSAQATNKDITFVSFSGENGFKADEDDTSISIGLKKGSELLQPINKILSQITDQDRASIMNDMVSLQLENDIPRTFWQSVGYLIDKYGIMFLRGAGVTMLIAVISTLIGFIIGLIVSMIKCIPQGKGLRKVIQKLINLILNIYIEVFRSTPMIVQSVLFYYGSKIFLNIDIQPLAAAFIVVSINTGAYLSEVVRGGINSIDKGQFEGAKAIGMNHFQTMVYVVLPQAIRNILPSIGNEFVINIKDTAVLNIISVTELFFTSKSVAGSTYMIFESYLITCVIYFVLTFTVTRVIMLIEKKLKGQENYKTVKGDRNE